MYNATNFYLKVIFRERNKLLNLRIFNKLFQFIIIRKKEIKRKIMKNDKIIWENNSNKCISMFFIYSINKLNIT